MTSSTGLVFAMSALPAAVALLPVAAVWTVRSARAGLITAIMLIAVMAAEYGLAASGVLREWNRIPPPMGIFLVVIISATVALARSNLGGDIARRVGFPLLVGTQAFRLPLELTMHRAASEGVMPVQMSYSGYNFDILTGASALVLGVLLAFGRAPLVAVRIWNIAGFCLLVNIVGIAIASLLPFQSFGPDRVNVWVTYPPFVWLAGVLVPAALLGHLLVWRKLAHG